MRTVNCMCEWFCVCDSHVCLSHWTDPPSQQNITGTIFQNFFQNLLYLYKRKKFNTYSIGLGGSQKNQKTTRKKWSSASRNQCLRYQHTPKPICVCYLSHAWKVIFSPKGLVHRIFFFQSFVYVYEDHLWIIRYMSIAYRRPFRLNMMRATNSTHSRTRQTKRPAILYASKL